ncbi:GlcNAc-transferase family protein [Halomonas lysinitropha]|uniref:Glycosyltransferase (GlcNAc) n=1 Tax=Halomonas lysinitropha TaxID=2607506 RepID=A0A5K1I9X8_9GAMM|nr:GlcNAc-transferase family protein [Halomonas lysinitropha]VVZ94659.1 Glycosyltransferase (GlcNAc) [Halomonas lysinitropha]
MDLENRKSIFVSIAAFCDQNLMLTLRSLFERSSGKIDIHVGVFDQAFDNITPQLEEFHWQDNIRYLYINPIESKGVCWARNMIGGLYDGEDFYLQIDSHTLFKPDWDTFLIENLINLKNHSSLPVISTYPPPFEFDQHGNPVEKYTPSESIYSLRAREEGFARQDSHELKFMVAHEKGGDYSAGHHVAGGFIFTLGHFLEVIPYDPSFYFHGEEQGIALRAYTRGWDIFHPRHDQIPLLHLYKQKGVENSSHHWRKDIEEKRKIKWLERKATSELRLSDLINNNILSTGFGLGSVRTLDEFAHFSGIDYLSKTIHPSNARIITLSPAPPGSISS